MERHSEECCEVLMGLKDIVVNILLALDPTAKSAFITNMATALNSGTNPMQANANIASVGKSLTGLGGTISRVRSLLLITFGGRIIANFVKKSIQAFLEFDQSLNRSVAIMGAAGDVLRDKLGAASLELSKELNIAATEINEAYYHLASSGMSAVASLRAIPIVAAFAKAGLIETATAARDLQTAVHSMGYDSKDAGENMAGMARVADVITRASKTSLGTIGDLTIALNNKAGPAFRQLGKDVEEAMAGLAVLANQGRTGVVAGERLAMFMRSVANAAITHKQAWKSAGVEIFDATGKMKSLADIVQEMTDYLGKLSPRAQNVAIMHLGMQQRSIDATKAFLGQADAIRTLTDEYKNADGWTEKIANRNMRSMAEQVGSAEKRIKAARIEMGEAFVPVLQDMFGALGDENGGVIGAIRNFGHWVERNHSIISNFVTGALWLLIHGMEAVFGIFNAVASSIVFFVTYPMAALIAGFEGVVGGVYIVAKGFAILSGWFSKDSGMTKFFNTFADQVEKFGGKVDDFRSRVYDISDLAYGDVFKSFDFKNDTSSRYQSETDIVDKAFKEAHKHKSKSNANNIGTDDSEEGDDKDAERRARKLQALMDRLDAMVASFTDKVDDDVNVRIRRIQEGFESIFGKDGIPKDIQVTLNKLKELGQQSDYLKVFSENMKDLKAHEDPEGIVSDDEIQQWYNFIDSMEQALPHIDSTSKAYEQLALMIAQARKELERLMNLQRKTEDKDDENRIRSHKEWLQSLASVSNRVVQDMSRGFQNFFGLLKQNMNVTKALWKSLGNAMVGTLFGGLGEYAMKKAKENSLLAAEELVKGFAAAVDPLRTAEAPGHFAAAAKYGAMAAAWSAAAGTGAYEEQRLMGASSGSGASDVGGKKAKDSQVKNIVNIYVDGVDPKNPRHQQLVGDTTREYMERAGTEVFVNPRRG
jgi:TP901 family phage tail tape measure protein